MAVWGKLKNSPLRKPIYYILRRRIPQSWLSFAWNCPHLANQFRPREDKASSSRDSDEILFSYTRRRYQIHFLYLFFFLFYLFMSIFVISKVFLLPYLNVFIIIFLQFFKFFHVLGCSGMFRDVPECSGMFRNVPCSWFYRRPKPITCMKTTHMASKGCIAFLPSLTFTTAPMCKFTIILAEAVKLCLVSINSQKIFSLIQAA